MVWSTAKDPLLYNSWAALLDKPAVAPELTVDATRMATVASGEKESRRGK